MWTLCVFIGWFFVIFAIVELVQREKFKKVIGILVCGVVLISIGWTQNYIHSSEEIAAQQAYKPGEGARILDQSPEGVKVTQKYLSKTTTTGLTDEEFNSVKVGYNINEVYKEFGLGIPVGMSVFYDEVNNAHLIAMVDYPSKDHKGDSKVVFIFYDSKLVNKYLKPLDWFPDRSYGWKIGIDDSHVVYY